MTGTGTAAYATRGCVLAEGPWLDESWSLHTFPPFPVSAELQPAQAKGSARVMRPSSGIRGSALPLTSRSDAQLTLRGRGGKPYGKSGGHFSSVSCERAVCCSVWEWVRAQPGLTTEFDVVPVLLS